MKTQFLMWLGVAGVSLLATDNIIYSLSEIKKEVVYSIMSFWLFYTMTKNKKDFVFLSYFVLFSSTLILAYSVYTYFELDATQFGPRRSLWLYGKAQYYSSYMFISAVLCLAIALLTDIPKLWRVYALVIFGLALTAQYFTSHRAGYVAVVVAASIGTYMVVSRLLGFEDRKKKAILASVLILLVLLSMIFIMDRNLHWSSGLEAISNINRVESVRFSIWTYFIYENILKYPILGSGFGNKYFNIPSLYGIPSRYGMNFYPHNIFLSYAVMMGIPGLVMITILFGKLYALFKRNLNRYNQSLSPCYVLNLLGLLILIGFVVQNMTDDVMVRHGTLFFWSVMGMLLGSCKNTVFSRAEIIGK